MKKIKGLVIIFSLFLFVSCDYNVNDSRHGNYNDKHQEGRDTENSDTNLLEEDMHKQHESVQNKFAHQDIIILDAPYKVEASEKSKFQDVISSYIDMKSAFVKDDLDKIDESIVVFKENVNKVNGELLKKEGTSAWKQHAKLYTTKLDEMAHIDGIENKRSYFSHISEIMYCTLKSFDFAKQQKLYVIHCPMAFEGKGAYWISDTKVIKNPYFGSKMLNCGSVKEEL